MVRKKFLVDSLKVTSYKIKNKQGKDFSLS
jgi:hypothetical protein